MRYGTELIIDLKGCDPERFTRSHIQHYMDQLCELIEMEKGDLHFWDDVDIPVTEHQTDPKTKGTSAVQFILTSSIVIHTLDLLGEVYVNIFSCKPFVEERAAMFTRSFFGGNFMAAPSGGEAWRMLVRGNGSKA